MPRLSKSSRIDISVLVNSLVVSADMARGAEANGDIEAFNRWHRRIREVYAELTEKYGIVPPGPLLDALEGRKKKEA